jgi:hypothetical protein
MINIVKSKVPRENFNYDDSDIIEAVKFDFFNMCYICEERIPRHSQTDHYSPQKFYPEKENCWENLFYVCEKCNNLKRATYNKSISTEIYNCCEEDVESLISLRIDFENERIEIKISVESIKQKNTFELLNKIYNGINSKGKYDSHLDLQIEIQNKIEIFIEILENYDKQSDEKIKIGYEKQIKEFISKEINRQNKVRTFDALGFVSFKRQIIKNNPKYQEFIKYFD